MPNLQHVNMWVRSGHRFPVLQFTTCSNGRLFWNFWRYSLTMKLKFGQKYSMLFNRFAFVAILCLDNSASLFQCPWLFPISVKSNFTTLPNHPLQMTSNKLPICSSLKLLTFVKFSSQQYQCAWSDLYRRRKKRISTQLQNRKSPQIQNGESA